MRPVRTPRLQGKCGRSNMPEECRGSSHRVVKRNTERVWRERVRILIFLVITKSYVHRKRHRWLTSKIDFGNNLEVFQKRFGNFFQNFSLSERGSRGSSKEQKFFQTLFQIFSGIWISEKLEATWMRREAGDTAIPRINTKYEQNSWEWPEIYQGTPVITIAPPTFRRNNSEREKIKYSINTQGQWGDSAIHCKLRSADLAVDSRNLILKPRHEKLTKIKIYLVATSWYSY